MMKTIIEILIKPAWKWIIVLPLETIGVVKFFFPASRPFLTWPILSEMLAWYWWIIVGLFLLVLFTAIEASSELHKRRTNDNRPLNTTRTKEVSDSLVSTGQSGGLAFRDLHVHTNKTQPESPMFVELKLTPRARFKNQTPHIDLLVSNMEDFALYCKVLCRAIYTYSGQDIKRDISDYANYFSWSGGSKNGEKEIPGGLDGTVNLVKINKNGYGIVFLFDENPHSFWKEGGNYQIDLSISGYVNNDGKLAQFDNIDLSIKFHFKKNEIRSSHGSVINNGELSLIS
jgi:hypothetical protein